MLHDDAGMDEEVRDDGPRKRGRKKIPKEFKLDKESKNRIRRTPEIFAFYQFVLRYSLREDVFRTLVLNSLGEGDARRVRKLLLARGKRPAPVEATA